MTYIKDHMTMAVRHLTKLTANPGYHLKSTVRFTQNFREVSEWDELLSGSIDK